MKSIKLIMLVLVPMLALTSCSDFFDNDSPSAVDAKDVFSDETKTEQAIYAVYDLLGSNNSYRNRIACGFAGLNTDAEWSTWSAGTNTDQKALVLYNCGQTNSQVSSTTNQDLWTYLNTMIERSNNIIEGIRDYGNPEGNAKMSYFLGEALFLRSFCYLEMVKYWGDVPARFVSIAHNPDGIKSPKADRNLIYEQLRMDLAESANRMPWSEEIPVADAANKIGRPSKAAALALLARADLMYAGKAVRPGATGHDVTDRTSYAVTYNIEDAATRQQVYKEALEACAQVIKHEDKLASDYETPFRDLCKGVSAYNSSEFIWVMPFKYNARGQVLSYNAAKISSTSALKVSGRLPGYSRTDGNSSGHVCVSPYLLSRMEKGDARLAVLVVPGQWQYDKGDGETSDSLTRTILFPKVDANDSILYQKHTQINNFYCGKYRYEWYGESGKNMTSTDDGVAFPVLRYADVLLMFAEAELGSWEGNKPQNNTGLTGLDQVNKIRTRAKLSSLGSYTMDDIERERAIEFCGEYIRKWDLMRWGMLKERMIAVQTYITSIADAASRRNQNMGDTLFYKYTYNEVAKGYYIDVNSLYGLRPGENERQPEMTKENGWQAKDMYTSDSKGNVLSTDQYPIYNDEDKLETRQYWPIFITNVTAAGSDVLWNNYGYNQ